MKISPETYAHECISRASNEFNADPESYMWAYHDDEDITEEEVRTLLVATLARYEKV